MRILYFTQYFPPEVGATQTRAWEMASYLVARGHSVTIVTEVPNHPSGVIPARYRAHLSERSRESGIDVLRLWVWAAPEKTFRTRMRFYLSYMGMASLTGILIKGKYDLVYATSPPLFVGGAGLATALARRIPFVLEVRDLWPESAVALGELGNPRTIRAAELLERLLYGRAARIVAVTRGIQGRLLERGVPQAKLALIENGANTERFRYDPIGARRVARELDMEGKFIAMYAGIIGVAQGMSTLVQAAHLLREREDIRFVFVGEGPKKLETARLKEELGLRNVTLLPEVPSSEMPAYLSAAGCALVPLRNEPVFRGALPSKMFEAWACSRPVVLSVEGEAAALLDEAGGGIAAPAEDAAAIARAIERLAREPATAQQMGERGRAYVEAHYSRSRQARKLKELLLAVSGYGTGGLAADVI